MAISYICEGTCVRTVDGREGMVVCVDRTHKIACLRIGKSVRSEKFSYLRVISYKGVE